MKLIIDISKDRYDEIMAMDWKNGTRIYDEEIRAIHDGRPVKQEPCEDAISRQAVLDINESHHGQMPNHINHQIWQEIKDLPSVNPQEPKTGHWKRISMDKYVQHAMAYYMCSECGNDIIGEHNYCPNCGAKMAESEEKE